MSPGFWGLLLTPPWCSDCPLSERLGAEVPSLLLGVAEPACFLSCSPNRVGLLCDEARCVPRARWAPWRWESPGQGPLLLLGSHRLQRFWTLLIPTGVPRLAARRQV